MKRLLAAIAIAVFLGAPAIASEQNPFSESALAEIQRVTFPWYYWGAGCRLSVCGEWYRLSFAPPGGGRLACRVQGWQGPEVQALVDAGDALGARQLGSAWRAVLCGKAGS